MGGVAVGGLEEGTGAGGGVAGVEGDGGGDGGGEGGVGGGAVGAAEVADVAAHEDEGCGGGAGEAGYVAYGVLWGGVLLVLTDGLVRKGVLRGRGSLRLGRRGCRSCRRRRGRSRGMSRLFWRNRRRLHGRCGL